MTELLHGRAVLRFARTLSVLVVCMLFWPCSSWAAAPTAQQTLDAVDFKQRIGAQLPDDLQFVNAQGKKISLSTLSSDRPMVLAMVWYSCPSLCPMLLDQLARVTADLPFAANEYNLALVSIAPNETPAMARDLRERLRHEHGESVAAWHFLTGDKTQIDRLANAVGFEYAYDPEHGTYAHPAGLVVLEPGGRINRYLFGVDPDAPDVKLALLDAGKGELGNPVQQVLLRCYRYNPANGQYSVAIMEILQVVGVLFLIALVTLIVWVRPGRRRAGKAAQDDAKNRSGHEQ